ncbi:hypothetical protein ABK040_011632 [Willaertia magna]
MFKSRSDVEGNPFRERRNTLQRMSSGNQINNNNKHSNTDSSSSFDSHTTSTIEINIPLKIAIDIINNDNKNTNGSDTNNSIPKKAWTLYLKSGFINNLYNKQIIADHNNSSATLHNNINNNEASSSPLLSNNNNNNILQAFPIEVDKNIFHHQDVRKVFCTFQTFIFLLESNTFCFIGNFDKRFGFVKEKDIRTTIVGDVSNDVLSNAVKGRQRRLTTVANNNNNQSDKNSNVKLITSPREMKQFSHRNSSRKSIKSQIWLDDEKLNSLTLVKFRTITEPISEIFIGGMHSIILTESGKVFGLGSNEFGQLGIGPDISFVGNEPVEIYFHKVNIKHVVCDEWWTFFLSVDGQVFVCGKNRGFSSLELDLPQVCLFYPLMVTLSSTIVKSITGSSGSIYFNLQNFAFSYGNNSFGQLAIGNYYDIEGAPFPLNYFIARGNEVLDQLFALPFNSVFITASNNIYVCGKAVRSCDPVCVHQNNKDSELERIYIKKVVNGDGYGNVILFLTDDFEVYRYFFDSTTNTHHFDLVLQNVSDICCSGKELLYIRDYFTITCNNVSITVNRDVLSLMKIFSVSDVLNDSFVEYTINDFDIPEPEIPLKFIVKFCNRYLSLTKKRKVTKTNLHNHSRSELGVAFELDQQKIWHGCIYSLTDSHRKSISTIADVLKIDVLKDILDLPLYLKHIEKESRVVKNLTGKKNKKVLLPILDSYLKHHKEKGRDDKFDKNLFSQNEEYIFQLHKLSYIHDMKTLNQAIFNYLRLKLSEKTNSISSKVDAVTFPTSFEEMKAIYNNWFSLRPRKKRNTLFNTSKKPKPVDIVMCVIILCTIQRLIENLPTIVVPNSTSSPSYRNLISVRMDFSNLEVDSIYSIIKDFKQLIGKGLENKNLAVVQKKRQSEFANFLENSYKGDGYNVFYKKITESQVTLDFLMKYCVMNCFTKKIYWDLDGNETNTKSTSPSTQNKSFEKKSTSHDSVSQLDNEIKKETIIEESVSKNDLLVVTPVDNRNETENNVETNTENQSISKSIQINEYFSLEDEKEQIEEKEEINDVNNNTEKIVDNIKEDYFLEVEEDTNLTLSSEEEESEELMSINSFLKTLKKKERKTTISAVQTNELSDSESFKQALSFATILVKEQNVTPLQARKKLKNQFFDLTTQELASIYIELVKLKK